MSIQGVGMWVGQPTNGRLYGFAADQRSALRGPHSFVALTVGQLRFGPTSWYRTEPIHFLEQPTSGRLYAQKQNPACAGFCSSTCEPYQLLAFSLARRSQVSTTVSGFSDTDSMPSCINHSARSG